ncbi:hypothetical protein BC827DRAFT_1384581 [Russula dissimulans]|jgi:hypothetical protein|nr:hypothetical protein BC827DRAFT_1384581 [Russula dissimulans]
MAAVRFTIPYIYICLFTADFGQLETDLYQYTVYKPTVGDALVHAKRQAVYVLGPHEALYAAVDTYLIDTSWVSTITWKNNTDATQTFTHTYSTNFKITKGDDVNFGYSVAQTYKGISVTIEGHDKNFDTTEKRTITVTFNVPPRSRLVFYQKRYRFKDSMTFILNYKNAEWNVGHSNSARGEFARKECEVEIMSEDYATLTGELDGRNAGTMEVKSIDPVKGADRLFPMEMCPELCRTKLSQMGANPG